MRVCVVGSGGREHALAHVLGRDAEVVVTPGNPGIPGSVATPPEEIDADLEELEDCRWFSREEVLTMLDRTHPTRFVPPKGAIAYHLIRDWAVSA